MKLFKKLLLKLIFSCFSSGSDVDWCQLWLWNGNVWVSQHLSGPWFPAYYGCTDSSWFIQEQQDSEEDQEKPQTSLLDWGLSGKTWNHYWNVKDFIKDFMCCVWPNQGAKLFYLSGMVYGEYQTQEVKNLGRFISVMKFRPLVWQTSHPHVLVDRYVITFAYWDDQNYLLK